AFALILGACRRLGANERFVRDGRWTAAMPYASLGTRVHGKTLGIIGFGAIGQAVARRAAGFDMPVCYTSRSRKPDAEAELGARFVATAEELVSQADIITLHTPLTAETRGLVDAELLARCKPGAVLINTGRGPLVDEAALVEALASGHVFAAGLDVFENEPEVPDALLAAESALLTPHIGSATEECRREIVQRGLANIVSFLETGEPLDRV
ncbi:MAG: NAD(P)-dependent oxidoreductase, partial [Gammaproteobacteria bacterium]